MKLTDKQLEDLLLKSFETLDKLKDTCKITVSQCLQLHNVHNACMRSCLETIDTTDLCKLFIINRSPNTKKCVGLTLHVLETNMKECDKIKDDKQCKEMTNFCSKILKDTHKLLEKLFDSI